MFYTRDIQRIYRSPGFPGAPGIAISVSPRLGDVWFAGFDRVLPPEPARPDAPWCQISVVPEAMTDGIEDRLVVSDAELARHGLAWVVGAEGNRGNVFLSLTERLGVLDRLSTLFGDRLVQLSCVIHNPLDRPRLQVRRARVSGVWLTESELRGVEL